MSFPSAVANAIENSQRLYVWFAIFSHFSTDDRICKHWYIALHKSGMNLLTITLCTRNWHMRLSKFLPIAKIRNSIISFSLGEMRTRILLCLIIKEPTYQLLQFYFKKFKNMISMKLVHLIPTFHLNRTYLNVSHFK